MSEEEELRLPCGALDKQDTSSDAAFYALPRLVTHIDDGAIAALTECYREALPAGGVLLDLMSSWVSHLPADVGYGEVIGYGLNAEELGANPRLSRWVVQDLNWMSALDLADASIDAAMICVSIQYLQKPVAVLRELARVLKPEAPLVVSFSNRCFPTKAVKIWLALDHDQHADLIALYLTHAGFDHIEVHHLVVSDRPGVRDPMTAVVARHSIRRLKSAI